MARRQNAGPMGPAFWRLAISTTRRDGRIRTIAIDVGASARHLSSSSTASRWTIPGAIA
jgi:hypothetical protein